VAFNRSLAAHNRNRDLERPFGPDEAHLAVDREMFLLRLEDEAGNPIGAIDWFSVHPINVHNDNRLITPDNKGHAAREMERAFGGRFVAAFAQGAAADVTPNYRWFPPRPMLRGRHDDDHESARFNGDAQRELATRLFSEAGQAPALAGEIDAVHGYFDFVDAEVPPRFADGYVGVRTGAAAIGARMLGGTAEGPGITGVEVDLARALAGAAKLRAQLEAFAAGADAYRRVTARYRAQGNKDVFLEPTERKVLGVQAIDRLPLPDGRDPVVGYLKHLHQTGAMGDRPWTPHVLPLHLAVVGPVAIAALPAELTTQAGRRLRASIQEVLAERGVTRVVLTGYANAYAGYVTTPEEYDRQDYEGASTHFGRHTLGAYQAFFDRLARELLMAPSERPARTLAPPPFDLAEVAPRSHAAALAWRRTRRGG
jgi:neutral ceramidase